ncbi:MAG: histidine kinase, partial [Pseudomonadota bacterium]|nr:histidine kinase [Pseudomonadota bacterium]
MQRQSTDINHSLLRIYSYYRTALGSILLLIHYSGVAPYALGHKYMSLFVTTSAAYTLLNILALFALWLGRFEPRAERIFGILLIDIVAITLIIHSSGGMGNGLSFLLLICVATGGILLSRQLSFVIAAIASLILIAQTAYNINLGLGENRTLFSAGSLGVVMFVAAFSFSHLSMRLRQSSMEAAIQAAHARHLERIAQSIVERMQTGVVVCAANGDVEVIN